MRPPAISDGDVAIVRALSDLVGERAPGDVDHAQLGEALARYRAGAQNGAVSALVTQLECNLGTFRHDTHGFRDREPAVDALAKRRAILAALEGALLGDFNAPDAHPYELTIQHLVVDGVKLDVTELCRAEWAFILFRATTGAYYLDVVKNHSAAYWSERARIDEAEANALLADPSPDRAERILAAALRRRVPT